MNVQNIPLMVIAVLVVLGWASFLSVLFVNWEAERSRETKKPLPADNGFHFYCLMVFTRQSRP
ncbi:MAG: hypothetical protein P8Z69_09070 [Acidihalobacter sp.]